jgi:DNA-binding SARP family transcriptional activator
MSILLTKVRQPQKRKDILRRIRLVDTIHQNIHRKLTFVSAPAGYGKTTLLADFASDVDANVVWYLIGSDDKNPVDFVRHIIAAFQQKFKNFGTSLEQTLALSESGHSITGLAIELLNEVETKIDDFTILVLDDYHLAGENEEVVEFIEKLIEHLPDQLRILIGSRSVYGIPAANLYIRDELVTINADELRFRPEDLQRLVAQNYQFNLSDEQAAEFAQQSDGWIVAILLALRTTDNLGAIPKLTGGTEKVYEYLAEEVINRQSPELRDFMYCSSILGDFDEALCNYVRNEKDSAEQIKLLEEHNLFVTRTESSQGPSFRYHQLFAEFLTQQFRKHDSARLNRIHNRAAEWHREREEWDAAIMHKLESREYEEAAKWIDDIAHQLYTGGRQGEITKWYRRIEPLGKIKKHAPHLLLYQAKIFVNQNSFTESDALLDFCEPALRKKRDLISMANTAVTRAMLRRSSQNYDEAINQAEKGLKLLTEVKKSREKTHQELLAERVIAFSLFAKGEIQESLQKMDKVINGLQKLQSKSKHIEQQRYAYDLAETLTDMGYVSLINGDLLASQQSYEEALAIHKKTPGNHGALALAHNNIAYVFHISGSLKQAWRHYSLGLEHAEISARKKEELSIKAGQASVLIDIEEYEDAENILTETISSALNANDTRALIESQKSMAELKRRQGRLTEAITTLRDAYSHEGRGIFTAPYYLGLAKIYLDMNHIDLAKEQLSKMSNGHQKQGLEKENSIELKFLLFRYFIRQQASEDAKLHLEESLKEVAALGYDQFLVSSAKTAIQDLDAISETDSNSQIEDFISRVKNNVNSKEIYLSKDQEQDYSNISLQVRSLGQPEVRINGEIIPPSAWKSSGARALFHYIVDKGKVRKEEVGLKFWPDFSRGKMSSNFHATLWRVRKALKDTDVIVFVEDHYQINPQISLWHDALEFENGLKLAREINSKDSLWEEQISQALSVYSGPYLDSHFLDWIINRRTFLELQYIEALISLASADQRKKNYSAAIANFKKVLVLDPFRDQVHLDLMDCLAKSDQVDFAVKHYRQYRELLKKELDADPIPNLQKFYDKMIA